MGIEFSLDFSTGSWLICSTVHSDCTKECKETRCSQFTRHLYSNFMHLYFILMGIILGCMIFCTLKRIWVVKCNAVQQITLHNTYVMYIFSVFRPSLKIVGVLNATIYIVKCKIVSYIFLFLLLDLTKKVLGCFQPKKIDHL